MIRIEVELCERSAKRTDILCRLVQGYWSKPIDKERRIADKLFCRIRGACFQVGNEIGKVEEIEGEELERLKGYAV